MAPRHDVGFDVSQTDRLTDPTLLASLPIILLSPNSARIGYATKWLLYISTQLSTDAVRQRSPKGLGINQIPSTGLRHPSFNFWRKMPESDARSVGINNTVEAT